MRLNQAARISFLAGLILSLGLLACGKKEEKQTLQYNFEENGCATGEHSADSLEAYCANLKDDKLNNGRFCAYTLRKGEYDAKCSGFGSF